MVRGEADVARLAEIADPGVLLPVATADVGSAVGRGVVRNDQLEILVALAKQSLQRLGEVVRAVVDRKSDAQPGYRVHFLISYPIKDQTVAALMRRNSCALTFTKPKGLRRLRVARVPTEPRVPPPARAGPSGRAMTRGRAARPEPAARRHVAGLLQRRAQLPPPQQRANASRHGHAAHGPDSASFEGPHQATD